MTGSALQRSVQVPFRVAAFGSTPLQLRGDVGVFNDSNIHLLLFPDVSASLHCDVGEVSMGNSKLVDVAPGVFQVSGSDTASLPLPPTGTSPTFDQLYAFDSEGVPTSASAVWDAERYQVRLSRRVTAAFKYGAYKAGARMVTYKPKVQASPDGGVKTTYGVVVAYYQGSQALFETTPSSLDRGNATIELYRIYSYKVINNDGQFEKPPGYPAAGTYPDAALEIVVDGSREVERVHQAGFIDVQGRAWVQEINVNILEPYVSSSTYTPVTACRIASLDPTKYPADLIARANDFIRSRGLGCKT